MTSQASTGIIGAGRRADRKKLKGNVANKVVQDFHARAEKERQMVQNLIFEYDKDQSGILDQAQLTELLKDYSLASFGRPGKPTEEDINCLEALCAHPNKETTLASVQEIVSVLDVWFAYIEKAPEVEKWLAEFDKTQSGTIDGPMAMTATYSMKEDNRCELRPLLVKLNGGQDVPQEVVSWVWEVGDVQGNGKLNKFELTRAVAAWYAWADVAWFENDEAMRHPNALKIGKSQVPDHLPQKETASCSCTIS